MKTTGRQWAGRTAVVGTVFIALGAFWLSFTALADLAARSGVFPKKWRRSLCREFVDVSES